MCSDRTTLRRGLAGALVVLAAVLSPVAATAQAAPLPSNTLVTATDSVRHTSAAVVDTVDVLAAPFIWVCRELGPPPIRHLGGQAPVMADSADARGGTDGDSVSAHPVVLRTSHLAPRLGGRFAWRPVGDEPGSGDSLGAPPARRFSRERFAVATGSLVAADALLMVALSDLWYTERAAWHWYSDAPPERLIRDDGGLDDWHTYVQMDKAGHVISTWHLARGAGAVGRWTGLSDRAAGVFGGVAALAFQSQIEVLDGYDANYGASRTDLLANLVGSVLGGLQVAHPRRTAWFTSKFSYRASPYYDETTSVAGNSIKDYDGQSYWLVVRPSELGAPRWWPRWLAASAGYGGDGLEHAYSGVQTGGSFGGPEHRREFYIGLDLDVLESERDRLPRLLRPVASALSVLRLPMPALQFGAAGTRWHWLFY